VARRAVGIKNQLLSMSMREARTRRRARRRRARVPRERASEARPHEGDSGSCDPAFLCSGDPGSVVIAAVSVADVMPLLEAEGMERGDLVFDREALSRVSEGVREAAREAPQVQARSAPYPSQGSRSGAPFRVCTTACSNAHVSRGSRGTHSPMILSPPSGRGSSTR
jgi:hypothetical protein